MKTGEYENIFSSVLNEEEQLILISKNLGTKETALNELKILTIRERRILDRIQVLKNKDRDLVITKIQKNNDASSTEAQNTLFLIGKMEDALTRIQESKRRYLDLLYKVECDQGALEETSKEKEVKKNFGILDSINNQLKKSEEILGGDAENE